MGFFPNVLPILFRLAPGTPVLVQFDSTFFIPATFQAFFDNEAVFRVGIFILRVKASTINAIVTL